MTKLISLGRVSEKTKDLFLSEVPGDGVQGLSPSQGKVLFCRNNPVAPYNNIPCDIE